MVERHWERLLKWKVEWRRKRFVWENELEERFCDDLKLVVMREQEIDR